MSQAHSPPELLEDAQRLSASLLWQLQRNYYRQQGINAWSTGVVPHYITNNPFIAAAYAEVVVGYLGDWLTQPGVIDPTQPLYIVELGAGTGRFAYHFVRALHTMQARGPLADLRCVYVLTDLPAENVAFWQAHPAWQPWIAQGLVDFAHFDVTTDQEVHLLASGGRMTTGTAAQPLVVLANYVLDSIPQDLFNVADGQLSETLLTLHTSEQFGDRTDPALLPFLSLSYTQQPITLPHYADADLDRILALYQHEFAASTWTLPSVAIRLMRTLQALAGGRLLLLSGDKGDTQPSAIAHGERPPIATHGSFSMMVNYHALGEWATHNGGAMLQSAHAPQYLNVIALLLGAHPANYPATRAAFRQAIEQNGPDAFYVHKKAQEALYGTLSGAELLDHLQHSGWDANILLGCFTELLQRLPTLPADLRPVLLDALEQVWTNYYHIGEARNLPFALGVIASNLGAWRAALPYLQHSLALYGPHSGTTFKLAICHERLGEFDAARHWITETLELEPGFPPARLAATRLARAG